MNIEVKLVDRCRLKSIIIDTHSRVDIREVCFLRVVLEEIDRSIELKVSLPGVESLWCDCTFIPADWGSMGHSKVEI